ncbi:MAG: S9 family peptidase [Planctomycetes bacterium]|nr:S9 family peptidase [Planctomycetota bacterium]
MPACQTLTSSDEVPRAKQVPHVLTGALGDERHDPYYWLRDRENPEVIAYLEAENAYAEAQVEHSKGLRDELFEEIKGRIKQDDSSVPARKGDWYYYTRTVDGMQYPIHCRRAASADGPTGSEQVLLDVNELAEGHEFFSVTGMRVSPDAQKIVFCTDTRGRRIYSMHVKDLNTGEIRENLAPDMAGNVAWANDNRTLFYTKQDPKTLRSHLVYRHDLDGAGKDILVFDEVDETFYCSVYRSRSGEYLFIHSGQTITDEVRFLSTNDPTGEWKVVQPRERGLEYGVDHANGAFWIRTNWKAKNFRLMKADPGASDLKSWEEFIPARESVYLEGMEAFRDHLVLVERENALTRLRVMHWDGGKDHAIAFDEPAYIVDLGDNREWDTGVLRFNYESMTTPDSTYEYDMDLRERKLLRRQEVLGGFNPEDYITDRVWIAARDGKKVPVSLVKRADAHEAPQPLLLYGYGSYGASMDPYFSAMRLSLLDRGFTFALAHIRGGQELGRAWYEDGKLLNKRNTFTDFIDCGEALCDLGWTATDKLYAQGGSAGGLLVGAVANMAPDLFDGIVAQVPFVDVVTTMEDDSIPLTTFEYDEWGNPADPAYYEYMLSYSPYDNVEEKDYPNLLVMTGLHDSQVQYWEPAKWVARLRERKTDDRQLFFKTEMHAGHGGASGRYRQYEEVAFLYAWLLGLAGR